MSVVARIEMPLNCLECPMYDWNRQKLCCNAHLDLRPIPNGGVPKPDWCPIICQLPEEHGRLGDLDELAAGCDDPYWCRWLSEIEDAPTIVPAEAERSET